MVRGLHSFGSVPCVPLAVLPASSLHLHVSCHCAQDGGNWWCEACNAASVPEYRYVLQVTIQDCTGSETVTMFQVRPWCLLPPSSSWHCMAGPALCLTHTVQALGRSHVCRGW